MKIKNPKEARPPPPAEGKQVVGMKLFHSKVWIFHGLLVHKSCCYSPATVLSLCLWFYNHSSNRLKYQLQPEAHTINVRIVLESSDFYFLPSDPVSSQGCSNFTYHLFIYLFT